MFNPNQLPLLIAQQPPLPFKHAFPGGVKEGDIITICGMIKYEATRLELNLKTGSRTHDDYALHFNPRFDENRIVLNHYSHGKWGNEESHPMCFQKGQTVAIAIEIQFSKFKISVDGRECFGYSNRMPLPRITTFEVEKGLQVSQITLRQKTGSRFGPAEPGTCIPPPGGYMPPQPGFQPPTVSPFSDGSYPHRGQVTERSVYSNPSLPFNLPIRGGISHGKMIYISGRPHQLPDRFHFNFVCSQSRNKEIAFHFDVRFDSENCVVRNSMVNGTWGKEERHGPSLPFFPGCSFDVIIRVEKSGFMVAVNNTHFVEYAHRIKPLHRVDKFEIGGNANITSVKLA